MSITIPSAAQKGDQMKINGVSLAPEYDSAVINVTFVLGEYV